MKTYDVQTVALDAAPDEAFRYIADPVNLPEWTHAFRSADRVRATMATRRGAVEVALRVDASALHGTIDWTMAFPDGSVARAASRLVPHAGGSLYTFVLTAPPVPLEELEGALAEQSRTLTEELARLAERLRAA